MSALLRAFAATKITETLENYLIAHEAKWDATELGNQHPDCDYIENDYDFWHEAINNTEETWGKKAYIHQCVYSEWVSRVPGLYWSQSSKKIREMANNFRLHDPLTYGAESHVFQPLGKSAHVTGGVGSLKFAPDDDERCLASVSMSANTSSGIPILISQEVLDHHRLKDGDIIQINGAKWRKMTREWMKKFPSVRNIPRGYLQVDEPNLIEKQGDDTHEVAIHPFSIMRYEKDGGLFYDFVYVTVDASNPTARGQAIDFFERYRSYNDMRGEYLLAVDPADPYFDALYLDYQEILHQDGHGKSQLDLIKERLKGNHYQHTTLDELMSILPQHYNISNKVVRLAENIGIPVGQLNQGPAVNMIGHLLGLVVEKDMMDVLIDTIIMDYPQILQ